MACQQRAISDGVDKRHRCKQDVGTYVNIFQGKHSLPKVKGFLAGKNMKFPEASLIYVPSQEKDAQSKPSANNHNEMKNLCLMEQFLPED